MFKNGLTNTANVLKKEKGLKDIKYGFIIKENDIEIIDENKEMNLAAFQEMVNGYIELVHYVKDDNYEIIVNENGVNMELYFNFNAFLITGYQFYGNVAVLKKGVLK
jgi:uncharacterized membrane protein